MVVSRGSCAASNAGQHNTAVRRTGSKNRAERFMATTSVRPCGASRGPRPPETGHSAGRRWGRGLRGRFIVLKDTYYFAQKTFLFLRVVALSGTRSWKRGASSRRIGTSTYHRRRRSGGRADAEDAREQTAMLAGDLVASVLRFRSGDESRGVRFRTGRSRQAVRILIQLHVHDPGGLTERLHIFIRGQLHRAFHEVRPDRRRSGRSAKAKIAVVVETNPHDAEQVAGIAGKPAVVRGASLSCGRSTETHGANARGSAVVNDALHHVRHDVGNAWIENRRFLSLEILDKLAVS